MHLALYVEKVLPEVKLYVLTAFSNPIEPTLIKSSLPNPFGGLYFLEMCATRRRLCFTSFSSMPLSPAASFSKHSFSSSALKGLTKVLDRATLPVKKNMLLSIFKIKDKIIAKSPCYNPINSIDIL